VYFTTQSPVAGGSAVNRGVLQGTSAGIEPSADKSSISMSGNTDIQVPNFVNGKQIQWSAQVVGKDGKVVESLKPEAGAIVPSNFVANGPAFGSKLALQATSFALQYATPGVGPAVQQTLVLTGSIAGERGLALKREVSLNHTDAVLAPHQ
jgi:hypothetical protein